MTGADVSFVHLGITIPHMVKSLIGGISFAYYGLIIGIGMIMGLLVAQSDAKRRGQDPDIYVDFALYGIIFSIIGARIYYVFFSVGILQRPPAGDREFKERRTCDLRGVIAGS